VIDRVRFVNKSVFDTDLHDATVVALYLLPWMNAQLKPRLLAQLRPGARIVAHMFVIPGWTPDKLVRLDDIGRVVYGWIVPAKVNGRWACAARTADGRLRRGTIDFEQEYQTVVASAVLSGREVAVGSAL